MDPMSSPVHGDLGMKKKTGRRKIKIAQIEFIDDKSRRQITFSKRKAGLMKKAYELTTLTGTQALLLVASETGHVYTFATPKLQPFVTLSEGKALIQSCLSASDPPTPSNSASHSKSGMMLSLGANGHHGSQDDKPAPAQGATEPFSSAIQHLAAQYAHQGGMPTSYAMPGDHHHHKF